MLPATVIDALEPVTGKLAADVSAAGGGCINETLRIAGTDGRRWFLKLNRADFADVFAAEAEGLEELRRADAIRVPRVQACGVAGRNAYLLLDDLQMTGRSTPAVAAKLGEQLAALHRYTAGRFGWHRDNHIGATEQLNGWYDDWIEFFRERRLKYQLDLAMRNGYASVVQPDGERVLENMDRFFDGYTPVPSLLHGDLWGGNWGVTATGEPAIFDPAVYYGDREADLAMTRLFGGFPPGFYAAYENAWPLHEGAARRVELYNLYHLLNHLNLFGSGYGAQVRGCMRGLLLI